jgi:hypothetical protein
VPFGAVVVWLATCAAAWAAVWCFSTLGCCLSVAFTSSFSWSHSSPAGHASPCTPSLPLSSPPSLLHPQMSVRRKLNAMPVVFAGKNVLLIDDSIVRGTTMSQIVDMVRKAGAAKVGESQAHLLLTYVLARFSVGMLGCQGVGRFRAAKTCIVCSVQCVQCVDIGRSAVVCDPSTVLPMRCHMHSSRPSPQLLALRCGPLPLCPPAGLPGLSLPSCAVPKCVWSGHAHTQVGCCYCWPAVGWLAGCQAAGCWLAGC